MLSVHRRGRHVHERLVDADLLHVRRFGAQYVHDGVRHLAIAVEAAVRPDGVRAQALRRGRGHGASHAVRARLVGRRGHHAVLVGVAAHDDGLAAPGGMVQLLDRSEERVEVHEQDGRALPRLERHGVAAAAGGPFGIGLWGIGSHCANKSTMPCPGVMNLC